MFLNQPLAEEDHAAASRVIHGRRNTRRRTKKIKEARGGSGRGACVVCGERPGACGPRVGSALEQTPSLCLCRLCACTPRGAQEGGPESSERVLTQGAVSEGAHWCVGVHVCMYGSEHRKYIDQKNPARCWLGACVDGSQRTMGLLCNASRRSVHTVCVCRGGHPGGGSGREQTAGVWEGVNPASVGGGKEEPRPYCALSPACGHGTSRPPSPPPHHHHLHHHHHRPLPHLPQRYAARHSPRRYTPTSRLTTPTPPPVLSASQGHQLAIPAPTLA